MRDNGRRIQERLDDVVRTVKTEERAAKENLAELERKAALSVLGHRLEEIRRKHEGNDKLLAYLDAVQENVLASIEDFKGGSEEAPSPLPFLKVGKPEPDFSRYSVNVIVNNGGTAGAPCVFESNPTYYNLFGRIEHRFQMGAALTDFTLIKCGSLHKSNGGFLVINALDLLRNIFSYDALKRAIRNREVKIEDVWEQYRLVTTTSMKPEPIPLDVKVVLIGNPEIYYLLYNLDEEYRELFKVKADFDDMIDRTDESVDHYAAFVATKAKDEALMPFTPEGVARVVDFGSRLAEDQEKLSTKFSDISNLLKEANYWAKRDGAKAVTDDQCHPGAAGEDHAEQPDRGADAGACREGDPHRRHGGGTDGPGERTRRVRPGRLQLREAVPHHRHRLRREGRRPEHRARDEAVRQDPREGGPHPVQLSRATFRPERPHQPHGVDHLRAALRDDRGRLRHLRGAVRAPFGARRGSGPAGDRRDGLDGPERRRPADRRASTRRSRGSSTCAACGGSTGRRES